MKDYNKMTKEELIKELETRSPAPTTEDIQKIMPMIKRIQLYFKDKNQVELKNKRGTVTILVQGDLRKEVSRNSRELFETLSKVEDLISEKKHKRRL